MQPFTERVLDIIVHIPKGKVMTYGQIAKLAGNPRAARQVARILHSMSKKYKLPWHRVINAKGEISLLDEELQINQTMALEGEGVPVINNKVDLNQFQYNQK
ncbi:MGMT family protein [Halalkalibacter flavus]|uniref:MGMT family protein n=1 Tax=Halalkalibacter flavus TaxID=3090668 RepID=UPI002FC64E19